MDKALDWCRKSGSRTACLVHVVSHNPVTQSGSLLSVGPPPAERSSGNHAPQHSPRQPEAIVEFKCKQTSTIKLSRGTQCLLYPWSREGSCPSAGDWTRGLLSGSCSLLWQNTWSRQLDEKAYVDPHNPSWLQELKDAGGIVSALRKLRSLFPLNSVQTPTEWCHPHLGGTELTQSRNSQMWVEVCLHGHSVSHCVDSQKRPSQTSYDF